MRLPKKLQKIIEKKQHYTCKECGYRFPKATAERSGLKAESGYGIHIHCPKCGAVVAQQL